MSLKPNGYRNRLLDSILDRRLDVFGAVEVAGPKYCGKTWMSMSRAQSICHLDDERIRQMAELDVTLALEGEKPHVIDEWQDVPQTWDAVRRAVDESGNLPGQFLLTGSSSADKARVSHSGAGRIARLHLRPMSLLESGESTGAISLRGLFESDFAPKAASTDARALARMICRGGWPAAIEQPDTFIGDLPAQYLAATFDTSAVQRGLNKQTARRLSVSLARNLGRSVSYRTMYADIHEESLSQGKKINYQRELAPYIEFLEDQYFIENQFGWNAPIKSRSRIRSKSKRTFADPSLPASLLGMTPERLLQEMQVFGTLFEELCVRDVRIYASALGMIPDPLVCYYSDVDGLEIDIIVELPDGRWGAFEVKLSEEKVPEAERNLLRLQDKIALNPAAQNRPPSFLAVLVGKASFCRKTANGVYVIPITELGT